MRWHWAGFLLAMVFAGPCAASPESLDTLAQELAAARQDVRSHVPDYSLSAPDGSEAARSAVAQEWSLIEEIVAADLTAGGNPKTDIPVKDLNVSTVALNADTVLVSADLDGLGTVFVARKANGGFHAIWRVGDLAADQLAKFPLLGIFALDGAAGACDGDTNGGHFERCGPVTADIANLGEDDAGGVHFYLNAQYSNQQGNDVGYQLSIWRWDGGHAVPELSDGYGQTLETPVDLTFRAPFLSLHAKDSWNTFYVTAPEDGRQVTWTLLMEGNGVRDLGRKSLEPELDAVDTLFDRILRSDATDDIAAPKVRAEIEDAMQKADVPLGRGANADDLVGELIDSDVIPTKKGAKVCVMVDPLDPWRFSLIRKGDKYFIAKATHLTTYDSGASTYTHEDFVSRCSGH